MTNADLRRSRILDLYMAVKQCHDKGKTANQEKIIGLFALDYGVRKYKTLEYINELISAGKIKRFEDKGEIWLDIKGQIKLSETEESILGIRLNNGRVKN